MKAFVNGRKSVFNQIKQEFEKEDQIIWLHAASLGEYEQGIPVLEELKKKYPTYKILISFFSPSGYEVKKNNPYADLTIYLPLDTFSNAKRFIQIVQPKLALFVKYEIWPNYINQLKKQEIPTILISGNFRPSQIYFKWYGQFMKRALASFDYLFVQTQTAKDLLLTKGFTQVSVSGDTRFDRVNAQLEMNNHLDFIETFIGENLCLVCGSTWPDDEKLLIPFINQYGDKIKIIVAPHQIKQDHMDSFLTKIKPAALRFSQKEGKILNDYNVFIIDTVGLLSKIYAYAHIAYVGGAAGNTGLHNILEPATFGVPIIIGQNHHKFPEAELLRQKGGLFVVKTPEECKAILGKLTNDSTYRKATGALARQFIEEGLGATHTIVSYIDSNLEM